MSDQYTPTTEEVGIGYVANRSIVNPDEEVPRIIESFERWLASVKAEAWDEAVEALDRSHGDIYPIAVKALDKRNPYRKEQTDE